MRSATILLSATLSLYVIPATASPDLAKKSGCMACHAPETSGVGPSFHAVAKKYAGNTAAPAQLAEKVRRGGQGVWGNMPCPPNRQLKKTEIDALVKWILSMH